ncbi:ISPsy8, transposase OrfA [Agrilactobacillus composti DSM 18527 = JCM 14202]|uniref:ISPsy8, transposase OrfA n=1 Tax=Agrilactobacillus composti DSM 18527 = JCM 14202 TaxID=1423734 RepID=A0A0R1XW21_9LACO|nr:helix-turn-helix domain-containing protein [Agrilactobacillus composti]KRM34287.1 ISPsy8, transposase OrfA [Agrilactobacillus composti DSM 18527 = JCM 14202]
MTKYSSRFRAKIVSRYLEGNISYEDLCAEYNISGTWILREWVQRAKVHGIDSIKVKHSRTVYPQDYKLAVVEYVHTHQVSCAQAAARFGISTSQAYSWNRIVREQGVAGLRPKAKGRHPDMSKYKKIKPIKRLKPTQEEKYKQEILELKQQLHEARLDRDLLKALATLTRSSQKHSPRK